MKGLIMDALLSSVSSMLGFSAGTLTTEKLFHILLIILFFYIFCKIDLKIIGKLLKKSSLDPSIQTLISTSCKVLLFILSTLIITEYLGIPTTSLVALLSVVSLAISLSIQNLLSNVFGGFTLLLTRPFTIGDYVELDNLSGKVIATGLIHTKLLTPENKTVYLPNNQVSDGRIINYSTQTTRRIEIFVGASYNAPIETVKLALLEAIQIIPDIASDQEPEVFVRDYLDSSIQYVLHVWVPSDHYWPSYYLLMEEIKHAFDRHEIAMDYPHLNVHMTGDHN